jgi:hypothetical protein
MIVEWSNVMPAVRERQVTNERYSTGKQAHMIPILASINVQIPLGMKFQVASALFSRELDTVVVLKIPQTITLKQVSIFLNPLSQCKEKYNLQPIRATQQKDPTQPKSLPHRQMQFENLRNRNRNDQHIRQDVRDSIRHPETILINAFRRDTLIPDPSRGQTLQNRSDNRTSTPSRDNSQCDPTSRLKRPRDEDTFVEQHHGSLIQTHDDFVGGLCDVVPF